MFSPLRPFACPPIRPFVNIGGQSQTRSAVFSRFLVKILVKKYMPQKKCIPQILVKFVLGRKYAGKFIRERRNQNSKCGKILNF